VSLSVKAGEMLAVVGPSGSGKSTLLRCLAGLEPLTDGHVTLLDANLGRATRSDIAELLRDPVGVLLATPLLVPSLTVRQNVELPGLLATRSSWSTRELAMATLSEMGVDHLAHRLPDQLTPAQATLVSLARVVAQNPRIIFADEPTGRLTVSESKVVIDRLDQFRAEGTSVVLATHDLHLAARASRVMILVDGQVQELLDQPSASAVLDALGRATGECASPVEADHDSAPPAEPAGLDYLAVQSDGTAAPPSQPLARSGTAQARQGSLADSESQPEVTAQVSDGQTSP